jgi:hypothetical protein
MSDAMGMMGKWKIDASIVFSKESALLSHQGYF